MGEVVLAELENGTFFSIIDILLPHFNKTALQNTEKYVPVLSLILRTVFKDWAICWWRIIWARWTWKRMTCALLSIACLISELYVDISPFPFPSKFRKFCEVNFSMLQFDLPKISRPDSRPSARRRLKLSLRNNTTNFWAFVFIAFLLENFSQNRMDLSHALTWGRCGRKRGWGARIEKVCRLFFEKYLKIFWEKCFPVIIVCALWATYMRSMFWRCHASFQSCHLDAEKTS